MKIKTMIIITIVLAILTTINAVAILSLDDILEQPLSSYSVEVLGAAFKEHTTESNTIDIDLIRPPREVVVPGATSTPNATITNTADFETYLRATYRVDVKNGDGDLVEGFASKIDVNINDGWFYRDGYWYYSSAIQPGETVPGLIASITYSKDFLEHLDYKAYIPVLVESVEAADNTIEMIDYWPNKNIKKFNIDYLLDDNMGWTQTAIIQ